MADDLPTFQTSRLTVRPRRLGDLDACLAMDRDPAVTRFIAGPWTNPIAHRAFIEARMRHAYPARMGYWTVLAPEGFAGWVLLTPLDLHGPQVEIGWRFVRLLCGRGYATEASRAVLAHALGALGLNEVVADRSSQPRVSRRRPQARTETHPAGALCRSHRGSLRDQAWRQ
jgi:RimJ/RimL family protein N-acetyltransferase